MNLSHRLSSALIYVLIPALMLAPVSYAAVTTPVPAEPTEPTPLNYDFVFSLEGDKAQLAFKQVDDGYLYWHAGTSDSPKLLTNEQVAEAAPQPVDDGSRYRTALQDGLGGYHEYFIIPDPATEGMTGRVESAGSTTSRAYSLRFASTATPDAGKSRGRLRTDAIMIVIGAAAIGAIGCAWNAIATDCATDCSRACRYGMKSSSEGWCGQCTCICYPPPTSTTIAH